MARLSSIHGVLERLSRCIVRMRLEARGQMCATEVHLDDVAGMGHDLVILWEVVAVARALVNADIARLARVMGRGQYVADVVCVAALRWVLPLSVVNNIFGFLGNLEQDLRGGVVGGGAAEAPPCPWLGGRTSTRLRLCDELVGELRAAEVLNERLMRCNHLRAISDATIQWAASIGIRVHIQALAG